MTVKFLGAPEYESNHTNVLRQLINVVKGIMQGKTNNTDSVTLTANTGTTTVSVADGRIGQTSFIAFMPTTANAATEFGAGTMYVSSRSVANNTFTITHTNGASADRTFYYVLIG
jgi:LDH2 family malate/lactate/ureidoglycolate dehydrogenase